MGNCVSCSKEKNGPSSDITLAIIGPDDAGKTTLSSILAGEPLDPHVSPTVGFRNVKFTVKKFDVTLYDLGGGKNIRPIWKNYFNEIYGVVYMVDSSSPARLKEARDALRDTLEHPLVSGKPLLVLANKADVEGHMEEADIVNQLDLDQTVNMNNCPSHFVMISALQSTKAKMKKVVIGGFLWLLGTIQSSMDTLEPRVKEDMRAVKEMRDKEREERRERVRKQREEREKEEDRERVRLGIPKEQESDEEEMKGDPFKPLDYNKLRLKEEKLKAEKKKKQQLAAGKLGANDRSDLQRVRDDANIGYSMDDTMTLPRFGRLGPRFGKNTDLDGLDISQSTSLTSHGRNTRPSALPPLDPIVSHSLDSKLTTADKKKGKKKKGLEENLNENGTEYRRNVESGSLGAADAGLFGTRPYRLGKLNHESEADVNRYKRDDVLGRSYHGSKTHSDYDIDREMLSRNGRDDSLGRLDFSGYGSRPSYTEADVHDLTPRVAKPKNSKVFKAGRIDEDESEDALNQYKNMRMSLKEYGDPRMSQKLDEYGDKYPLRSSVDNKSHRISDNKYLNRSSTETNGRDGRRWDKSLDRENSAYRKSLKNISPPDLDRFDEDDKDEGIEDDSDNASEDLGRYSRALGKHRSTGKQNIKKEVSSRHKWKDVNANKRHSQYSDEDEDEDEDEYSSKNTLKDTLKFSRYDDDPRKNYERELTNLKYRRDNDYKTGYRNRDRFNDSDDDRLQSRTPDHLDNRRKKKKNILKSNKLMPSDDDDGDMPVSHRYSSPRLVQEHGSRNTSDTETPSKGRNSRTTYFHRGSSRDSDLGPKWGLAEDLPSIDNDSRVHRNFRPNYDDSDGEDVVF